MMNNREHIEKLKNTKNCIANFINTKIINAIPTEEQIKSYANQMFSMMFPDISKEDNALIIKMLLEQFQFKLDPGTLIYDEEAYPWFKKFKEENNNFYFDRYKEYLFNDCNYSKEAIRVLDEEVLDEIMDYLGDPRLDYFNHRRGLVMGDVQSGKTSTFIGMICKAADAGYKAIVVLTGTVESLRVQTQKRLDLGFVGFDTAHMSNEDQDEFWIGVSKYSQNKKGISLTSVNKDFVQSTAQSLGVSLDSFTDTVLFVVKKNTSVLNKLIKWLQDLNGDRQGKIDFPLLVIDDEADNASVNTKDPESDPSKINGLIRNLLTLFNKNNYVGFTATPFANIFINPHEEKDLFPKDFIYCLKAPNTYIGASDIFSKEGKYHNALRYNNDCEEVLPAKHKKYTPFDSIPNTLEDAIITYLISNVIRDIKGDLYAHRSMLINISSFTDTHGSIKNTVEESFNRILRKYALYCKEEDGIKDEILLKTQKIWELEYSSLDCTWEQIMPMLYDSNRRIEILVVNKNNNMINYDDYKENGARLIVIGGMALSRGLTLEGLCISYFYRFSKTYDVLLQMGRWFGYRRNYEELFRIWLPTELAQWYSIINESVEELKVDLERMKSLGQKPSNFGLRIRNDKTKLRITAGAKMRTATQTYETISIFGDFVDTPCITKDININRHNMDVVKSFLGDISLFKSENEISRRNIFKNVKKELILGFLKQFKTYKYNPNFDKDGLIKFFDTFDGVEFDEFDVVIAEGKKSDDTINFFGYEINPTKKQFDIATDCVRINKGRLMLVNPVDTCDGLTKTLAKKLEDEYKKNYLRAHLGKTENDFHPTAKMYLKTTDRNPLLIIYPIDLSIHSDADDYEQLVAIKDYFAENEIIPIGIALCIPEYRDASDEKTAVYQVNIVEQENRSKDEEYNEEEL